MAIIKLFVAIAASCVLISTLVAQEDAAVVWKTRGFLGQPHGLQACANKLGTCVIANPVMKFARGNLSILTKDSSLIVVGTISKRDSALWEDGSDVSSTYTVEPRLILKGGVATPEIYYAGWVDSVP